jgi:hypothetical protein
VKDLLFVSVDVFVARLSGFFAIAARNSSITMRCALKDDKLKEDTGLIFSELMRRSGWQISQK